MKNECLWLVDIKVKIFMQEVKFLVKQATPSVYLQFPIR